MHAHVTGWSAFAAMGSQVTFGRHEIGHDGAHGIDVGHFAHASSTRRIQNLTLFNRLIRYLLPCETQNTFYVQDACRYHSTSGRTALDPWTTSPFFTALQHNILPKNLPSRTGAPYHSFLGLLLASQLATRHQVIQCGVGRAARKRPPPVRTAVEPSILIKECFPCRSAAIQQFWVVR